jgi:hypothetical protein
MRQTLTRGGIFTIGLALLFAACGGDDVAKAPTPSPDQTRDDARAKGMLLAVSDFDTGWSETPDDDEPSPLEKKCPTVISEGRTGHAKSGDFAKSGSDSISHNVVIYDTKEHMDASWPKLKSDLDCLVKAFKDGAVNVDEVKFTGASVGSLSVPSLPADRAEAYRITVTAKAKNALGKEVEQDIYFDVIYFSKGPIGGSVQAVGEYGKPDTDKLVELTKKAIAKAK